MTGDAATPDFGALGFDQALRQLGEALTARPEAASEVWKRFADDSLAAGVATMAGAGNREPVPPTIEPARGDRRFKDAAWQENPVYSGMLQGYLLWSRMMRELVDVAELDRRRLKARFAVDAMIDALAPTNTLLGNPAALRRAFETGGLQRAGRHASGPRRRRPQRGPAAPGRPVGVRGRHRTSPPRPAGRVPQRADGADPVRAGDEDGARMPLLLSPAVDQQVLRDGPGARQELRRVGGQHGHTVFAISYATRARAARRRARRLPANGPLAALDVVQGSRARPG